MNSLTPAQMERLHLLAEEAAEVVQACTKILRYGYHAYHAKTGRGWDNLQMLEQELGDLRGAIELMIQAKDISQNRYREAAHDKLKRLPTYLQDHENISLAHDLCELHNGYV